MMDTPGPNDSCGLCHVKISTGPCTHLVHLDDDRVGMPRRVWERLVADSLRLRELTEDADV